MSSKLLLVLLWCVCVSMGTPVTWTALTTTSSPPPARWNAGLAIVGGAGYLFGGEGTPTSGILGDTWKFTVTGNTVAWTALLDSGPSARYGFVSGVVDGYWIISHGCNNEECFSDTWALDSATDTWSLLVNSTTQTAPRARFTSAGGVYPGGSDLWLSMGQNIASLSRKFSDTWVLRVNTSAAQLTAEWEEVSPGGGLDQYSPFLPHARSLHAGAPLSLDTFAIVGGCASGGQVGGPCPIEDSWTINLSDRVWQEYSLCPTGRTRAVLTSVPGSEGNGYLLGGSESWGPGVFSQQLISKEINASEVVLMTTNNANTSSWLRLKSDGGSFPENLDSPSVAVDAANGVVYYFGGRRLEDGAFQNMMWMLGGDGLDQPDLGCPQPQYTYVHLHGTLMYLAWGLFFPLGVLLARYYRWTWPCWFVFHVIMQCLGVLVTVAGFVVIFLVGSYNEPAFPHAIVGIILTTLMIQQFLSGIFHCNMDIPHLRTRRICTHNNPPLPWLFRGVSEGHPCVDKEDGKTPPEEKTAYRKCWEVYHAISGFLTIAIGLGQVTLGVFLIKAPLAVWAVWAGMGGTWVVVFVVHECVYVCCKIAHRGQKVY